MIWGNALEIVLLEGETKILSIFFFRFSDHVSEMDLSLLKKVGVYF